jgi:2-amino-4-hydroxy-6-hydroxymethyldihydropteridine diphosphokinase
VTNSGSNASPTQRAYLALGANLGDAVATLQQAIAVLQSSTDLQVTALSGFYRTAPHEAEGPDFCNAVIEVNTAMTPEALLAYCLAIEHQFGRVRSTRNAPRTLDIDLIAMGSLRSSSSALTLPHPRAHQRAFVLVPLCDINPLVTLGEPHTGFATAAEWLDRLEQSDAQAISRWPGT